MKSNQRMTVNLQLIRFLSHGKSHSSTRIQFYRSLVLIDAIAISAGLMMEKLVA